MYNREVVFRKTLIVLFAFAAVCVFLTAAVSYVTQLEASIPWKTPTLVDGQYALVASDGRYNFWRYTVMDAPSPRKLYWAVFGFWRDDVDLEFPPEMRPPTYVLAERICIPCWAPFLVFAPWPTIAFIRGPLRRWRRRRRGLCLDCSYDLTGNLSGVCSECGKTIVRS